MRRWLALLLLVLLPTQMSWAVVADYCRHEQGAAANHVGHHDHAAHGHDAASSEPADLPDSDTGGLASVELDCDHCHGQFAGVLASIEARTLDRLASANIPEPHRPLPAHAADQPERPQWQRLA
ncbi:hypothetical protein [Piscinibacter sp.]|uniref:hypothetical protein n=1 Tax=Piscinibacter sp. TaxID=1903157 RepID=UPI0035B48FAE